MRGDSNRSHPVTMREAPVSPATARRMIAEAGSAAAETGTAGAMDRVRLAGVVAGEPLQNKGHKGAIIDASDELDRATTGEI